MNRKERIIEDLEEERYDSERESLRAKLAEAEAKLAAEDALIAEARDSAIQLLNVIAEEPGAAAVLKAVIQWTDRAKLIVCSGAATGAAQRVEARIDAATAELRRELEELRDKFPATRSELAPPITVDPD